MAEIAGRVWKAVADILPDRLAPQGVWLTVIGRGYKGLYKSASADAIMHVADGNQIKHVPVVWDHEKSRWHVVGDEDTYWNAAAEGRNEYRTEQKAVPSVWAAADSHEIGSHVQAEVAQALDLGADRDLYQNATVAHIDPGRLDPAQDAVADGGVQSQSQIAVEDPGEFVDQLVPIGSGAHGDADAEGAVVSMQKYYETYPSVASSEEMKQQETRGRLAAQDQDLQEYAMKMLLIAGAIIIGAFAVAFIGPKLIGGGSGSGGMLGLLVPMLLAGGDE